ncbi:hypothetical protein ISF12_11155 [Pseudomonas aeruginosa]|nr:hypothetical protein [Pseudomonas aeruginosa]
MKKPFSIAFALICCTSASQAANESVVGQQGKTWHNVVEIPGAQPEDREISARFSLTYHSRLVEFSGSRPGVEASSLPDDQGTYKVLYSATYRTVSNSPAKASETVSDFLIRETDIDGVKTGSLIPVLLGYTALVDPLVLDPAHPDIVRTRAHLEHSVMSEGSAGKELASFKRFTEAALKAGEKELVTWSLNGRNYGFELELVSLVDNEKAPFVTARKSVDKNSTLSAQ